MLLPQLQLATDTSDWTESVDNAFESLKRVFGPNRRSDAAANFFSIKQDAAESLAAFLSRFERLLYESKSTDLNDAGKIAILKNGVNKTLRDRLDLQLSLPTTYEEFVESLHTLNTKNAGTPFRQPNSQFQPSHHRFTPRAAPTPTPSSDAMDLSRMDGDEHDEGQSLYLRRARLGPPATSKPTALRSTHAQREAWNAAGLCRRCGSDQHFVANCDYNPPHKSSSQLARSNLGGGESDDDEVYPWDVKSVPGSSYRIGWSRE